MTNGQYKAKIYVEIKYVVYTDKKYLYKSFRYSFVKKIICIYLALFLVNLFDMF